MQKSFRGLAALVFGVMALAALPLWAQKPKSEKEAQAQAVAAAKLLAEADDLYGSRDLLRAGETYRKVLDLPAENPAHARAYYGLARIAALNDDPEQAKKLFQKTLDSSPGEDTKSWAYLYLGRLADMAGEREQAVRNFRAVLQIGGAPEQVKNAAQKKLDQLLKR
jgi:tetratricopeptide (TPR) repeat protein